MLAVIRVPMARPAASSLDELTRLPVDKRSMAVARLRALPAMAFCATSDFTLVLITVMIFSWK
jgi:hypothetical protein